MRKEKTYRVESLGQLKVLVEGLNIQAESHKEAKEKADELIKKLFARLSKETSHCFWTDYTSYSTFTQDFKNTNERTQHLHPNKKQCKFLQEWCGERAMQDFTYLTKKAELINNNILVQEDVKDTDNEPTWGLDAMPASHDLTSRERSATAEIEEFLNAPIGLVAKTNKRYKKDIVDNSKGQWVERGYNPDLTEKVTLSE